MINKIKPTPIVRIVADSLFFIPLWKWAAGWITPNHCQCIPLRIYRKNCACGNIIEWDQPKVVANKKCVIMASNDKPPTYCLRSNWNLLIFCSLYVFLLKCACCHSMVEEKRSKPVRRWKLDWTPRKVLKLSCRNYNIRLKMSLNQPRLPNMPPMLAVRT